MLATLPTFSPKDLGIGTSKQQGVKVAIKKLMSDPSSETKEAFGKEIKFMARLSHSSVIRLLGVCLEEEQDRFLVMEYMENGDMAQFLKGCQYVETKGANLRGGEVCVDV